MNTLCESLSGGLAMSRIEVEGSTLRQVEPPVLVDTSLLPRRVKHRIFLKNVAISAELPKSRTFGVLVGRNAGKALVERCALEPVKPSRGLLLPGSRRVKPTSGLWVKQPVARSGHVVDFGHSALRFSASAGRIGDEIVSIPKKDFDQIEILVAKQKKDNNELSAMLKRQKAKGKLNLFNPVLDENELADSFYSLYTDCGKNKTVPAQKECDKLKFSAFLFYLVKMEGLGGERWTQGRFYEFIQMKVFTDLGQGVRTFNGRLTELAFLPKAVKKPKEYEANSDFKYFQSLIIKFRKTPFYNHLRVLRGNVSTFL